MNFLTSMPFRLTAALLILAALSFGQVAMTSTTAAAQVGQIDQSIYVASATGITAAGNLNQETTVLMVDREVMYVTTVNGTQIGVLRGREGTKQTAHANGATVWFGPPNYFLQQDPVGYCVASSYPATPMISESSGRAWTCNSLTNTWGQTSFRFISGVNCGVLAATTTTTDNGMVPVATNNVVHQFTTNATGGTSQITCDIPFDSHLDAGKGIVVTDVELFYGAQTTAISSIAAATVKTVTYPASTAAGVAAAGTVATAGGTYTVTPTTLQKATTTTGQCYDEKIAFGTPIALNTDNQKLTFEQVFTNSAAATVYQVCGLLVHYYVPQ
jgi:hypothetical protein